MELKRAIVWAAGAAAVATWLVAGLAGKGSGDDAQPGAKPSPAGHATTVREASVAAASGTTASDEGDGRDCNIVSHYLPNGDGTTTRVLSCEPGEPKPSHPYETYPTEALESLAYSDADAAATLSLRWRETDTVAATSMAVRAAALSGGDANPIVTFSNAYPAPTAVNGIPVRQTVHVKYVLGTVAKLLGDERHSTPYFEALIREHSEDPEREIALLQRRAHELLEEMRQIQLEVTGTSTVGG